jgi:hypothetical protein
MAAVCLVLLQQTTALVRSCNTRTIVIKACNKKFEVVKHVYQRLHQSGRLECVTTKSETRPCKIRYGNMCTCSAVGDPHYRTFDNQLIHFRGKCRYTLAKLVSLKSKCYFNIEVDNVAARGGSSALTRRVYVNVGGAHVILDHGRVVRIKKGSNNQIIKLPYRKGGLQIFLSGTLVQLVYTTCQIEVSFDGKSNAFLKVDRKRFAGKMTGLCGNCNGKKDDLKTKDGSTVGNSRQRFNLIGDSYRVLSKRHCPKTQQPPSVWCSGVWNKRINENKYCGIITNINGPFARCIKSGKVNVKQMLQDCRIDLCSNTKNAKLLHAARCEIMAAYTEMCAEKGISNMNWRSATQCRPHCHAHQVFVANMKKCPSTCANHFYGTKKVCSKVPNREGCECEKGYVMDGELCVKPKKCRCLNAPPTSCANIKGDRQCGKWKDQGFCKKNPKDMQKQCKKACTNCKSSQKCVDRASYKICSEHRRLKRCGQSFYKSLCGLTCNFDKCPCRKPRERISACHATQKVKFVYSVTYNRNAITARCRRVVRQKKKHTLWWHL